ncbi:uncharacterized protein LOC116255653 isoform X2 [Nymphaea colorata]|uniref:uncharacterized protein LOC116255653 isoform X2 n=1 Tax=Nymphaea colorata TaxID=210225 RepID=UPI00129EF087|nr:uncharacterized protein LOC116255653 isoform X2 [Nymphaea colorata]
MWRRNLLARIAISRDLCAREPVIRSPFVDRWKKPFSTSSEEQEAATEAFVSRPTKGLVYGRLNQLGKNTLKTDIIHFFDGCNLTLSDIRFDYNRSYNPLGAMLIEQVILWTIRVLQFPSKGPFDAAVKLLIRKGRLYRLEKADRSQWDLLTSYDGKTVLIQGVPRNASFDDVERVLSGCNFDSSSIQMFVRPGFPDSVRMALVQFPTRLEAMNAFLTKNRSFCLNNPISMRVLQ